jgi:hypothetical protein
VVYESMYGNTHLVADAIGAGLRERGGGGADVAVVPLDRADAATLAGADLLVVGGPTHAHGMSRESTRKAAVDAAGKPTSDLSVDHDAEGPGLRDWFEALGELTANAAAFDTRIDAPVVLTGRASKGIARQLREHGCAVIADPESFLVTKASHLEDHEEQRAREWGARLATSPELGEVSSARG